MSTTSTDTKPRDGEPRGSEQEAIEDSHVLLPLTEKDDELADDCEPFFIVGVGASAGGLEALETLFERMPSKTGMAFIVIQ
ncbi:MAG: hypothetical protein KDA84_20790, partial [Planctomycetaceae bacterium]|nr:hypothetical protein [Planctomycetaceae bacterium]